MIKSWRRCDPSTLLNFYTNSEHVNNYEQKLFDDLHKAIKRLNDTLEKYIVEDHD